MIILEINTNITMVMCKEVAKCQLKTVMPRKKLRIVLAKNQMHILKCNCRLILTLLEPVHYKGV